MENSERRGELFGRILTALGEVEEPWSRALAQRDTRKHLFEEILVANAEK